MMIRRTYFFSFLSILLILCLLGPAVKGGCAMTTEEERKLGKKVLEEIGKKVEFVNDLSLQTFINRVGRSLANQVSPTPFEFDFYLVKGHDPNAFAIPGGHIFITTGLVALAGNEPEVAGVLSHEISHVTARHVAQMIERAKRISIVTLAAMIAGAIAGRGGKASEAVAATAMAGGEAMMLKYTRDNEVDADQNGLHLMIKAGYDPQALISFLKKMERYSLAMAPKIPPYLSTHPALENRVSLLENLLSLDPKAKNPFQGSGNYRRIQIKASIEEREPSASVSHFESLLKAHPEDPDALFGLGLAFQRAGRLDKSIEVFQTASQADPNDNELLRELGIGYFLGGKLDQAIETLEPLGQRDDLKSIYYLGRAYQERGNSEQALRFFLKVRREAKDYIDLYNNLGSVYGRMGQKGLSHFSFARYFELKGDRNNALLHYRTALDWLEKGSPEREETQRMLRELTQKK
ncbi:MAG TPA: M48 family metalloprotease [Thermodesulfobacteriota bacterium]|nr:M48 family metalloprotease [Thermodesulfobacteriota bacterium]